MDLQGGRGGGRGVGGSEGHECEVWVVLVEIQLIEINESSGLVSLKFIIPSISKCLGHGGGGGGWRVG